MAVQSAGDAPALGLSLGLFNSPVVPYITTDPNQTVSALADAYASFVRKQGSGSVMYLNEKDDFDMENYLLDVSKHDFTKYVTEYMIAASFSSSRDADERGASLLAYFNNEAYHTPAISLAYIGNAILHHFTDTKHVIEATNHPLPRDVEKKASDEIQTAGMVALVIAMNVCIGVAFLVSAFVTFIIKERSVGSKHLQNVSGVHPAVFWAGTFTWDLIFFMVPSVLMVGIFAIFGIKAYCDGANAGWVAMHGCNSFKVQHWTNLPYTWGGLSSQCTVTVARHSSSACH